MSNKLVKLMPYTTKKLSLYQLSLTECTNGLDIHFGLKIIREGSKFTNGLGTHLG